MTALPRPITPSQANASLSALLIDDVTQDVFGTMFGMQISTLASSLYERGEQWSAHVSIDGPWSGRVRVVVPRDLLAQILFLVHELDPDDIDDESLQDTLSELANMIGGGFKAKLVGPCTLSLPQIGEPQEDDEVSDAAHELRLFCVEGQHVGVHLCGPRVDASLVASAV